MKDLSGSTVLFGMMTGRTTLSGQRLADGYKIHLFKRTPDGKTWLKETGKVIYQSKGSEPISYIKSRILTTIFLVK